MLFLKNRQFLKNSLVYLSQNSTKFRLKHEGVIPLFQHAKKYPNKVALYDNVGDYTHGGIFSSAKELSNIISSQLDGRKNEKVSFVCSNDVNYIITLWAIWMSGQIAVPLNPSHSEDLLEYFTTDSQSKLILATPEYKDVMHKISKVTKAPLHVIYEEFQKKSKGKSISASEMNVELPATFYEHSNALILYTNGTTESPKGVLLSHKNLHAQATSLLDAWKWSPNDTILHALPLNQIHGIINALCFPLFVGATTVMLPKFSPAEIWSYLLGKNKSAAKVNIYTAMPVMYEQLVEEWEKNLKGDKDNIKSQLESRIKIMVSAFSTLPPTLYEKWLEISGHRLLERYGLTETGIVLSVDYNADREPSFVGIPLPGVSVRLCENIQGIERTELECINENGTLDFNRNYFIDVKGELFVKGDGVFTEYYNRPELTATSFSQTGWFNTGDICEYVPSKNMFKVLGRNKIDVFKIAKKLISTLEIETRLLEHPAVSDCVVVGVNEEDIAALVIPKSGASITLDEVKAWTADYLPVYSIPTILKIIDKIPRCELGKVKKVELVKSVFK